MRCRLAHGFTQWRYHRQRRRRPVVLDFTMVDSNKDGAIDKDEFSKACSSGLVKANEATVKDMK